MCDIVILGWVLGSVCGHGNGTLGKLRLRSSEAVSYRWHKILFFTPHKIWKFPLHTLPLNHQSRLLSSILNVCMSSGGITNGLPPWRDKKKKAWRTLWKMVKASLLSCKVDGKQGTAFIQTSLYCRIMRVSKAICTKKSKWNIPFD